MANLASLCFNEDCTPVVDAYSKPETDALLADKQDRLTAGVGIDITNNVISSTVDADVFVPVTTLPSAASADASKIYLTPKTGGGVDEWHVIDESGTPTWDKFGEADIDISKENLLNILGLEEVEYEMTDCNGVTSSYIVLARKEASYPDELALSFYAGDYPNTDITIGNVKIYDNNTLIGETKNATGHTDIDGNGGVTIYVQSPTEDTTLTFRVENVSCDTSVVYTGTAEFIVPADEPPYITLTDVTTGGCIDIVGIYTN